MRLKFAGSCAVSLPDLVKAKAVAAMMSCQAFLDMLMEWGAKSELTNMAFERLLALIKQSAAARSPPVDRLCSSGLLAQMLADHIKRGRDDPRVDKVCKIRMSQPRLSASALAVLSLRQSTGLREP